MARVLVVAALLAWIAAQVHWGDYEATDSAGVVTMQPGLASSLLAAHPAWLLAAVVASILSLLVGTLRWRALLRVQDVHIGVAEAFRLGFLAEVFNAIIPGMVGGDAIKVYYVTRRSKRTACVVASVLVDRGMGVGVMALFALVSVLAMCAIGYRVSDSLWMPALSGAVVILGVCGAMALLVSARLRQALRVDRMLARLPFAHHITAAHDALARYRHGDGLAIATGLAAVAQVLGISSVAFIGFGLNLTVPWYAYLLYVPLVTILAALPITPGGWGVMEGLYLLFFSTAGHSGTAAALAVLARGVLLCGALPGIFIFAFTSERPAVDMIRQLLKGNEANGPRHD
ncbi:MAG: flippase-like domain-containing protein [Lentisphaerae bacterium]|nr:flippase-like domain-containing protein [Lentisphaerota bacterium]